MSAAWVCTNCDIAYPGPPGPGLVGILCTKCGGITLPEAEANYRKALLQITDLEEVLADKRRLTQELDVAINGYGAAKQASLCDLVSQACAKEFPVHGQVLKLIAVLEELIEAPDRNERTLWISARTTVMQVKRDTGLL